MDIRKDPDRFKRRTSNLVKKPTRIGWYFYKEPKLSLTIVKVFKDLGDLMVEFPFHYSYVEHSRPYELNELQKNNPKWWGPIEEPPEIEQKYQK